MEKKHSSFPITDEFMKASTKIELLDRMSTKLVRFRHKTVIITQNRMGMAAVAAVFINRDIKHVKYDDQMWAGVSIPVVSPKFSWFGFPRFGLY